ncbi:MAG: hypothetical protein JXA33_22005 [Anaerolineae bacterium]|nr:hypothetical protein [Anaerolineae bacterium]
MRKHDQTEERTSFQESSPYDPMTDSRADVAMVYGLNETFEERVARWRQAGYRIHVMTGVAWGQYQDYVRGEWDGVPHYDDAQAAMGGFKLEHGISQGHDCFYMMPSRTYARYLGEQLRRVVDAGALAIHLEEPEFWVRGGYGEGFQREWAEFYGEPWQDPSSSPDARYRAAKLKQYLYTRTLDYLFTELKRYAVESGKGMSDFKCYVPTHSLINYAHWRIVSPESQLLTIAEFDGLIGQVWTGTSRTANVYRGIRKQRTFEAGYCEYAACAALVRGTDKQLWQLADPIEDNPSYCWDDYRVNWECTVTGSLLVDESERFEIMPWPRRIFMRSYPTVNLLTLPLQPLLEAYLARLEAEGQVELAADTQRVIALFLDFYQEKGEESRKETLGFADLADRTSELRFGDVWGAVNGFYKHLASWEDQEDAQCLRQAIARFYHDPTDQRAFIPPTYATELQIVYNALCDMYWPGDTEWLHGQTGIGLAISDTLMYQRGDPEPSDPDMASLYGLAMPLVKHGSALTMVQLECALDPGYLDNVHVLLLTYEGQKPPSSSIHVALAEWVRRGNVLVLFGDGDAYNTVREWWNEDGADYALPQAHLTHLMGLGHAPKPGIYPFMKGWVIIAPESPTALAHDVQGAEIVLRYVKRACEQMRLPWTEDNILALRRGPYVVAAGMDESTTHAATVLPGTFVNLFDPDLTVITDPAIAPDTRWLLYDLARCPDQPWVIAAAGRVFDETYSDDAPLGNGELTFTVEGMAETMCVIRARLLQSPAAVTAGGINAETAWDIASRTVCIRFANDPIGIEVKIVW